MRVERIGDATLYLGDCLDILPTLGKVDAVVTDPPYGINISTRVNYSEKQVWDAARPDLIPWLSVGRYHLFWGGQYFAPTLPMSEGWLTWVKRPVDGNFNDDERSYATTEIAWRDWGKAQFFAQVWDGGMRAGAAENRTFCHPSQKPIELLEWCIRKVPNDADTILDPFMGSGTTGVACAKLGRKFIGIELEPSYFDIACERIQKAYDQPDLFVAPPKKAEQLEAML